MAEETLEQQIRTWKANDWDGLRAAWEGLLPKEGGDPTFCSQPLDRRRAGLLFERLVLDAFRLDGCVGQYPYPVSDGEHVDGLILDRRGWQGFLVESKFRDQPIGIDPIYRLHALVEQRPVGTLGLFFSPSGYTAGARQSAEHLKPIRVLMFWPEDLEWALLEQGRMMEMIWRKWTLAVQFGRPAMPIARKNENNLLTESSRDLFGEGSEYGKR